MKRNTGQKRVNPFRTSIHIFFPLLQKELQNVDNDILKLLRDHFMRSL